MKTPRILALITAASALNLSLAFAETIEQKAAQAIIPNFELNDATPADALKDIAKATGIKITYSPRKNEEARVTVALRQIPASEALAYVANLANLKFSYEKDSVLVVPNVIALAVPKPAPTPEEAQFTRVFRINAATFTLNLRKLAAPRQGESNDQLSVRYFKDKGIDMQGVRLDPANNTLMIRATSGNIEKAAPLIEQISTGRP
jgi:type II secretory pathway component GspD/PulD (secretin)